MSSAVGLFRRGPAWNGRSTLREHRLMREHRSFVGSLVTTGALEAAGPLAPLDEPFEGDYVELVLGGDVEALRTALEHDPAVVEGVLEVVVLPWHR